MSYRFLCVDDESRSLSTLRRICLEQNPQNEVYTFDDSAEALAFAETHPVDVALLDIDMPVLNGIRMTEKLMEQYPKLNVILVTAYSEYALDAYAHKCSGYLLKPLTLEGLNEQLQILRFPVAAPVKSGITVRCFGNFDVFFDGKPVIFNYSKTKELFAYLIDRRCAMCSNGLLAAVLWEDDEDHSEYLKKLKRDLTETLSALTNEEIFVTKRGSIAVRTGAFQCDYFDYAEGGNNLFKQEYMEQYSWAEVTKARLLSDKL